MFSRVLIANRGEIACRIARSVHALGAEAIAVYSEADAAARHVREADRAVPIGPAPAAASYLDAAAILEAARRTGAEAIHPGYGFLSEHAGFARAVRDAGLAWIGPDPEHIELLGDKLRARAALGAAGFPLNAGADEPIADERAARAVAEAVGYPVMLKLTGGGGGIGMRVVESPDDLADALPALRAVGERLFGDGGVLVERYLPAARHVEAQLLGLADGRVVALGDRECSVQRRNQKVVEEAPAPALTPEARAGLLRDAAAAAQRLGYRGAGTVECLWDGAALCLLEMNTRLQVEHAVTEMVTGVDLVAEQLRAAAGDAPGFDPDAVSARGHAIEWRVCAEDPVRLLPSPGPITGWREPAGPGVRVDSGYDAGDTVTPHYDSLLAKLVCWGPDRASALERSRGALAEFAVEGVRTNIAMLRRVAADEGFAAGDYDTTLISRLQATGVPA